MDFTSVISRLFAWVLHNEMEKNNVSVEDVMEGIKHMNDAYKYESSSLSSENAVCANYETAAFRCAYLHKYATMHTVLVSDVMQRLLHLNYNNFHNILTSAGCLNVSSLGGGPGSDIVGMMLALHSTYGLFNVSSNIVDCMPNWNATFRAMVNETQTGTHGQLRDIFSQQYFQWNYIGANLLENFSEKVKTVISSADIINMIKFVSAASCVDTESMIKRIFELMKPGAIVLFIDNSVGDIKFIMTRMATEYKMESLLGPINHEHYINPLTETFRFGYSSCYQTKIAIQVWRKPQTAFRYVENNQPCSHVGKIPSRWMQSTPIICKQKRFSQTLQDSFCSSLSSSKDFQIASPMCDKNNFSCSREDNLKRNMPDPYFENSYWLPINNPQNFPTSNLRFSTNSSRLHNFNQNESFDNSYHNESRCVADSLLNCNEFLPTSKEFLHSVTSTPFASRRNTDSGYWSPYSPYTGGNSDKFSYQKQISHSSNESSTFHSTCSDAHSHSYQNTLFDYTSSPHQINSFNFESNKVHADKNKRNAYSVWSHNKENVNIERSRNRRQRFHPYMICRDPVKTSSQLFCGSLF